MSPTPSCRPRGRPRRLEADPASLEVLSIPEALAYLRSLGRGISRARFLDVILTGQCPACEDTLKLDRFGRARFCVKRVDLEAWLASTVIPFKPLG